MKRWEESTLSRIKKWKRQRNLTPRSSWAMCLAAPWNRRKRESASWPNPSQIRTSQQRPGPLADWRMFPGVLFLSSNFRLDQNSLVTRHYAYPRDDHIDLGYRRNLNRRYVDIDRGRL